VTTAMLSHTSQRNWFVGAVFLLSAPIWLVGAFVDSPEDLPMDLPVSAAQFVVPMICAFLIAHFTGEAGAVRRLAREMIRLPRRGRRRWLFAGLVGVPALLVPAAAANWLVDGAAGPAGSAAVAVPVLVVVFLVAGSMEEIGWTGFLYPRLGSARGPVFRGLMIGAIWAAWHIVPLVQAGRDWSWIAAWTVSTVAARVLIVWIFVAGGRLVMLASCAHAGLNVGESVYPEVEATASMIAIAAALSVAALAATLVPPARRPLRRSYQRSAGNSE